MRAPHAASSEIAHCYEGVREREREREREYTGRKISSLGIIISYVNYVLIYCSGGACDVLIIILRGRREISRPGANARETRRRYIVGFSRFLLVTVYFRLYIGLYLRWRAFLGYIFADRQHRRLVVRHNFVV